MLHGPLACLLGGLPCVARRDPSHPSLLAAEVKYSFHAKGGRAGRIALSAGLVLIIRKKKVSENTSEARLLGMPHFLCPCLNLVRKRTIVFLFCAFGQPTIQNVSKRRGSCGWCKSVVLQIPHAHTRSAQGGGGGGKRGLVE